MSLYFARTVKYALLSCPHWSAGVGTRLHQLNVAPLHTKEGEVSDKGK